MEKFKLRNDFETDKQSMTTKSDDHIKTWEKKNQLYEERASQLQKEIKAAIDNRKVGVMKTHNDDSYQVVEDGSAQPQSTTN